MIIEHPSWRTLLVVCIFILLANNALMTFIHKVSCPACTCGMYGQTPYHKSHDMRYLHGLECRLSEPEVLAGQPKGMEQFWAIAGVVCLRALRWKLVAK